MDIRESPPIRPSIVRSFVRCARHGSAVRFQAVDFIGDRLAKGKESPKGTDQSHRQTDFHAGGRDPRRVPAGNPAGRSIGEKSRNEAARAAGKTKGGEPY